MNSVLLPTSYLPPVTWMAVALQSGNAEIEIHETYPKQTIRNRCSIATSSGILNLTVPVRRIDGNHTQTSCIRVDNTKNWQQLHWKSIVTAYSKSPFFLYYRHQFESVYSIEFDTLIELNHTLAVILIKALKLDSINFAYSTQYETKPSCPDLRNRFDSKIPQQHFPDLLPRYIQVFEEKNGFLPDLSIIDLLFNLGPEAAGYLLRLPSIVHTGINA